MSCSRVDQEEQEEETLKKEFLSIFTDLEQFQVQGILSRDFEQEMLHGGAVLLSLLQIRSCEMVVFSKLDPPNTAILPYVVWL